jgi:hypothetical protein
MEMAVTIQKREIRQHKMTDKPERTPAQQAATKKWVAAIAEGKRRKRLGLPPVATPESPLKPSKEPSVYPPGWEEGAYDFGVTMGENTAKKLWRSGWRGNSVNENPYHQGFLAGFASALKELHTIQSAQNDN